MKLVTNQVETPAAFKPVVLNLLLESAHEVQLFHALFSHGVIQDFVRTDENWNQTAGRQVALLDAAKYLKSELRAQTTTDGQIADVLLRGDQALGNLNNMLLRRYHSQIG